ncbi:MAG: hypothetical protein FWG31_09140 [Oscillospiraceae bacterium]|nr:hypothetical protein [Oscillospiraceae bacterium]
MTRKSILALLICGCLLLTMAAACSSKDEPPPDNNTPSDSGKSEGRKTADGFFDLTDINNYWMEINGRTYQLGDPFSKLAADFEVDSDSDNVNEPLEPGDYAQVFFNFPDDDYFVASIHNLSEQSKSAKEGVLGEIDIDQPEEINVSFAGGLRLGVSSLADIEAVFGSPDDIYEGDSIITWYYEPGSDDTRIEYTVYIDKDDGLLWSVNMRYYKIIW